MIDASFKTSIEQFLVLLAQRANLTDVTSTSALNWLSYQHTNWLMIVDNADHPNVNLQEYFPCTHGNILITSRNKAPKFYAPDNCYKIAKMSDEDSLTVCYKASHRTNELGSEHNAAIGLVHGLNYLALAIVQSASHLC
ncbi:hypothetical protein J132_01479 [Termitomyces sp. J132]|nr:hypothetical protein J132_01479 [Termitomyces sp. J132]